MAKRKPAATLAADTEIKKAAPVLSRTVEGLKSLLASSASSDKLTILRKVSEYTHAETKDVDDLLDVPFKVGGVLIHKATINERHNSNGRQVDFATGELFQKDVYVERDRTVFKLANGEFIAFVSIAIANYCREFLIPAFGMGDWVDDNKEPLFFDMKLIRVESRGGLTYSLDVL